MQLQWRDAIGRERAFDAAYGVLGIVVGYTLAAGAVSVPVVGVLDGRLLGVVALLAVAALYAAQRRRGGCDCC